jgi:hypothetical protein
VEGAELSLKALLDKRSFSGETDELHPEFHRPAEKPTLLRYFGYDSG